MSLIAKAECFFLNGKSTELAIPTRDVFEFDFRTVFTNVKNDFS